MITREETMKFIAEGVRGKDICPVVDEIARQAVNHFELAAECEFEHDEGIILFDLLLRLCADGKYMEAVDLLMMVFSLIEMEEAMAIVGIIAVTGRDEVYSLFMERFMAHSERIEVKEVNVNVKLS